MKHSVGTVAWLEVYDVREKFPAESDIGKIVFFFKGRLMSGWPLVDFDEESDREGDYSPIRVARAHPDCVLWETDTDDNAPVRYQNVRYWALLPEELTKEW